MRNSIQENFSLTRMVEDELNVCRELLPEGK
jgi:hypothetical protein